MPLTRFAWTGHSNLIGVAEILAAVVILSSLWSIGPYIEAYFFPPVKATFENVRRVEADATQPPSMCWDFNVSRYRDLPATASQWWISYGISSERVMITRGGKPEAQAPVKTGETGLIPNYCVELPLNGQGIPLVDLSDRETSLLNVRTYKSLFWDIPVTARVVIPKRPVA